MLFNSLIRHRKGTRERDCFIKTVTYLQPNNPLWIDLANESYANPIDPSNSTSSITFGSHLSDLGVDESTEEILVKTELVGVNE